MFASIVTYMCDIQDIMKIIIHVIKQLFSIKEKMLYHSPVTNVKASIE